MENPEHEVVQDSEQATQLATQSEAVPGSVSAFHAGPELYGCLIPCNIKSSLARIEFKKDTPTYALGRGPENTVTLRGMKISECCRLRP